MIALQGAHKVVLEGFLGHGCGVIRVLFQDVHHDFGIHRGLSCSSSDQTSRLDNLCRDGGCDHVGHSFLGRCRSDLPTRDHCLIRRGLVQHVRERKVIRTFERDCVHCVVLILAVPRVRDALQQIVAVSRLHTDLLCALDEELLWLSVARWSGTSLLCH